MAFLGFLTGGVETFIVVLLAVFILWVLWKIILAPLGRLFGFGAKNMGQLADYSIKKGVDSWFEARKEKDREDKEEGEEGFIADHTKKIKDISGAALGIIKNVQSTNDFNDTKIHELQQLLKTQEELLSDDERMYGDLISLYDKDLSSAKRIFNDARSIAQRQDKIMTLASKRIGDLENVDEKTSFEGEILRLGKNLREISEQLGVYEQRDAHDAQELRELSKQRIRLTKDTKARVADTEKALILTPVMQQLPRITENLTAMEKNGDVLSGLTQRVQEMVQERKSIATAIASIEPKIQAMDKEQEKRIQESDARIADLVREGKMAA